MSRAILLSLGALVAALSGGSAAVAQSSKLVTPATSSASTLPVSASRGRTRISLNDGWRYRADGQNLLEKPVAVDTAWEQASLPHTWNVTDPFDDSPSYRRGIGWYRRHLSLDESFRGKRLYLYFEGVNQVARVYVNGAFAGEHKGGYTAFAIDITRQARIGTPAADNLIAVEVNNAHDPFIPPLSVGFALYGGIYRDVWLVATDAVHLDMMDHGSAGVFVTTPTVDKERGELRARVAVVNGASAARTVSIVNTLVDAGGKAVASATESVVIAGGGRTVSVKSLPPVQRPRLWSPDDPYLYTLRTEIFEHDSLRDFVTSPVGFRWFSFDPQRGFILNGEKLQLRGTNRHQDYQGLGSALANDLHLRDLQLIKEMGANFLRLAHYPQDPAVLDAADRLGLLIWEEIPVVNYITPLPEFTLNSETMLREMIRQHHNHPSVIMWGIMNEVFLWSPEGFRIRLQADSAYSRQTMAFAAHLDSIARSEDGSRVTTMAVHGSGDYDRFGLAGVTQVLGQNIYSGWYSGVFDEFGKQLDSRHARRPSEIIFVSEYGAEDDIRVNSLEPERFDFSGTWFRRFHESYLRQINARPWLAGTAVWSQFDFSQPETGGSIPYMNQKGMHTWDRRPKDVFYLYKANWNPTPMVYIASRGWTHRLGTDSTAPSGAGPRPVRQPVDVYSNLGSVELLANGKSLGSKTPDDVHRATWDVPFTEGVNRLEARGAQGGRRYSDTLSVNFRYRAPTLADPSVPFRALGINTGGKAQVTDPDGFVWEADQPYNAGSFGYVGGELKKFDKDLAILATKQPPLYFTYLSGLRQYRFDVPDGAYEVELLFAEPDAKPGTRVFSVSLNGREIASGLDLAARYGLARAASLRASATASGAKGLAIDFNASKGAAILNAVRVWKR